ncbi:MAG TPA: alpha/beta hydrolase [Thermoleophilia bacterium]|nr:alpha/beta hydrolase [Thermoleophilia bacterium]
MKRPFSALLIVAVLTAVLVAAGPVLAWPGGSHAQSLDLQEDFNYVGAAVKSMTDSTGHVVNYIDQGEEGWRTVVLIGGAGTGARAFELTEFVRDLREELGIRVICVERNGIGMTEFEPAGADGEVIPADAGDEALALADPVKTREMYARDVLEVLDKEGVGKFSIIGISGGGPYTGELARQAGRRVRSIHLAVALYQSTPGGGYPDPAFLETFRGYIINPMWWWDMTGTTADLIPGWQEAAYEEAAWAAFVRGQDADPHAVAMDYTVYKMTPPDVSMVTAPVYTYYGELDTTVPLVNRDRWIAAYSSAKSIKQRNYPDGVHDVQYRHYDQILLDVAGYGDYLVVAWKGKTRVIPESKWAWYAAHGATLGIQAWVTAQPPES